MCVLKILNACMFLNSTCVWGAVLKHPLWMIVFCAWASVCAGLRMCLYVWKCVRYCAHHKTCYFKRFHCTTPVLLSPTSSLKLPMTTHLYRLTSSSVGFLVNNSLAATTFKVSTGCIAIFVTVKVSSAQMHACILRKYFKK